MQEHSPPRWQHEPVAGMLDGARQLTVSVVDRLVRAQWQQLALAAGVGSRRWRRHDPLGTGPVVALVDGKPAQDAAAWERTVSLLPGAVALPARTAAAHGIAAARLQPPSARSRLFDLLRSRHARAVLRRVERGLAAELARLDAALERALDAAIGPGEDGTPVEQLPAYALAARMELLLRTAGTWSLPAVVHWGSGDALAALQRLLMARGASGGDALLQAAALTGGAGLAVPDHLRALASIAGSGGGGREDHQVREWLEGVGGWHALRELHLEAVPLRLRPDIVRGWVARDITAPETVDAPDVDDLEAELQDAVLRARRMLLARDEVERRRGRLHAGIRALAWSLADRLERDGRLPAADDAFDYAIDDLLRIARGADVPAPAAASTAPSTTAARPRAAPSGDGPASLRGIPVADGHVTAPLVALDGDRHPVSDAAGGAVVACREYDAAWLPLLLLEARGLVVEGDGPLGCAARTARELGLPAVVRVRGLMLHARDGDVAGIDGTGGSVSIHPRSSGRTLSPME